MPQHLAALDVGPSRIRAVVFEASFRQAELVAALTFPIEPGADRTALWQQVRQALPARLDALVITADGNAASTRLVSFPFEDLRRVDAAVLFELENLVPYPIEEVAATWAIAQRGGGKTEVLAALTPREGLLTQLATMRAADLEPRAVVLPGAALAELAPAGGEPAVIVSLGESQSHLCVVSHGLRYARTLRSGGLDIDQVLAKRYNLAADKARAAKESEARILVDAKGETPGAVKVSEAVVEGLAPLLRDLAVTFRSLPAEHLPKKLLLTGGLSRLPGLPAFLEARLGIHVELVDLPATLGNVTSRLEALGPEHAVALAMALGLLRRGRGVQLNFRRGDLAYRGDLQVYRGELVRIAAGLAAVIVLAIVGSIVRYSVISAEESKINQRFCDVTKKIVGREICDPTAAKATMLHAPGGGEGVTLPPYSATALFDLVSRTIDPAVDATFEEIEIRVNGRADDPDKVTARGEAATFETTEQIVTKLKQHPCVQDAEVSKQRKARDSTRVEFNLSVKASCPAGVQPSQSPEVARLPDAPGEAPPEEQP